MRKVLHAYYDLAVSPASFDFFTFLMCAEVYRARHCYDKMILYIVPGPKDGFREDKLHSPLEERQMMLRNIVLSAPHLMRSCGGIFWLENRADVDGSMPMAAADVFPAGYSLKNPIYYYMIGGLNFAHFIDCSIRNLITAPPEHRNMIENYVRSVSDGRPVVTVTLRNNPDFPERNSDLPEWQKLCDHLAERNYMPVIVRETANVFQESAYFNQYPSCELASTSVLFRTALYEAAYLNLFVNNGTENCAKFADCRTITFRMVSNTNVSTSLDWYRHHHGLNPGDQLPFHPKRHRLCWEMDRFEIMRDEFDRMARQIEEAPEALEELHGFSSEEQLSLFIGSVVRHIFLVAQRIVTLDEVMALKQVRDLTSADLATIIRQNFPDNADNMLAAISKVAAKGEIDLSL